MHSHYVSAVGNAHSDSGCRPLQTLVGRQLQDESYNRFARRAQQDGPTQRLELAQPSDKLQIPLHSLAKANTRVNDDILPSNPGIQRYINSYP